MRRKPKDADTSDIDVFVTKGANVASLSMTRSAKRRVINPPRIQAAIAPDINLMRLHILSDIHLEFAALPRRQLAHVDCDIHILAGDIGVGLVGLEWALKTFTQPVIYVMGNHEFYGSRTVPRLFATARAKVAGTHVHLLENDAITIDGVRFLGASLWTDFCLAGVLHQDRTMRAIAEIMSDYQRIRLPANGYSTRPIAPATTRAWHEASAAFLEDALITRPEANSAQTPKAAARTVVVTHHAPSPQSLGKPPPFDAEDAAYASDLSELIGWADLWVHGHVHRRVDYGVAHHQGGLTRVLANPRGYAHIAPVDGFDAGLIVTLE